MITYIPNRFTLLQLLAMYCQQWSSVYQHLWISVTYFSEMQLPQVPSRLPKHSSSNSMNSGISLSPKVFATWSLYLASMLSLIILSRLPCLGPPMAYAHQSQNQNISKLWKSLGAGQVDSRHSSKCYEQLFAWKSLLHYDANSYERGCSFSHRRYIHVSI